eukprot:scaffold7207_cov520-Prasinococcus_capsulatus_cf.AAC.7
MPARSVCRAALRRGFWPAAPCEPAPRGGCPAPLLQPGGPRPPVTEGPQAGPGPGFGSPRLG